jgi:hypothetical protein
MKTDRAHVNGRAMVLLIASCSILTVGAADIPTELPPPAVPKIPVPKSPYIAVVYRYADTMLAKGRDTFGPQKTGLLLSALDTTTLAPLTSLPAAPAGVQAGERVNGANPEHDENLLRLLYTLSELTTKPVYREAADAELKWLLENTGSPLSRWDVIQDEPIAGGAGSFRPWMLWDHCFDLAPEPAGKFALALKDQGDSARRAGFCIRSWAVAYARTKDESFLKSIAATLDRFEKMGDTEIPNAPSMLSSAIDCAGAAHRVPEPLASRLREFAAREDTAFCALAHDLKTKGGFVTRGDVRTPLWMAGPGGVTTAQVGMMCVSRYENAGHLGHRELMLAAADAYLKSMPAAEDDVWPATFGHAISLQLAAWRSTARQVYFDRARELGDATLEKFFGQNALPRASLKSNHYETLTGADTLALALLELHLEVLDITAVRCPSNTIDR